MQIQNAVITGSFSYNGVDLSSVTSSTSNISSINAITASILSTTASLNDASGSAITRLNALEATSGSNITRITALEGASGSAITRLSALETTSGSNITRLSSLESKTGSYATTGSNIFVGGQYLSSSFNPTGFSTTASLYTDGGLRVTKDAYISGTLYLNNVTVYGTQSVAYITSSQLNISTNLISVNTDTPSVRFGGLSVYDSGSTGLTGSILWDSENNRWIYSNPSGSSYSGGMFISGPRTSTLGSETGTTACMLLAGQGGDHLTSSMIYHDSVTTCIPNTLVGGTACLSGKLSVSQASTDFVAEFINTANSTPYGLRIKDAGTPANNYPLLSVTNNAGSAEYFRVNSGTGMTTFAGVVCSACRICSTGLTVTGDICSTSTIQSNSQIYVIACPPANNGGVFNARDCNANGANTSFAGIFFNSSPGNDFSIGKLTVNSTGYLQIRNGNNGCSFLIFDGAGVACFACQVCVPQLRLSGTTNMILQPSFVGSSNLRNGGAIQYTKNFTIFTDDGASGCGFDLQYWNGSSYYPGLRLNNVSSGFANLVLMQDGGSVGIGTSSPSQKLEVYSSSGDAGLKIKSANCTGTTRLILNPEGAGAGSTGDGVIFFDVNSTAWVAGVDKSDSSKFKIANDVYGDFRANNYLTLTTSGNVGINTTVPSQKLHLIGGFLQTADNSSWYRNVFERNVSTWDNVVGFSPQSSPQYTYGYINITASGYVNGTSAGGVTTSRWYYSITNNSISVSVVGSDISTGSQAPSIRLVVSSGTIYVQVQSGTPAATSYTTIFVDAMLASGYVNGTYWLIS